MSVVDQIEIWAVGLCRMDSLPLASAASTLGVTGRLERLRDVAVVSPPPPGIARLQLLEHAGTLFAIEISLAEAGVQVADLERRFGAWRGAPSMPADPTGSAITTLWFNVAEPGASHQCAMFVGVRDGFPTPASPVASVTLRRDRAR